MKNSIARGLIFNFFMIFILAFGVQSIVDVLIPQAITLHTSKPPKLKSPNENEVVPVAVSFDIAISEIMYTTDTDKSPQWIELHNRSTRKVSLEGWEVAIMNHPEDKSVITTNLIFPLDAKILDANQVLLLVTEQGPNSGVGSAKGDLRADGVVILKDLVGGTPGYRLLSQTAFKVTLRAPTTKTTHKVLSEIVGNLGVIPEWKLPLVKGNRRNSIIRVCEGNNAIGEPYDGTAAYGWELASEKKYQLMPHATSYGHHTDLSTPGYRSPVPLPVSLSSFRPFRERATGEVVITWVTEAELNNAGFNIKRGKTKEGPFKIINQKGMIAGHGTTMERHVYTYRDTTARPTIVYYYQLESISLDGTRRTLATTRLRGHIGGSRHFEEAPFWWKDLNR